MRDSKTVPQPIDVSPIDRKPASEQKLQQIANQVNRHLAKVLDEVVAAGEELLNAKRTLPHGAFERLFQDHARPVKEPIRFSSRHGQRLMKIAEMAAMVKTDHRSLLPPNVTTLYALTALPASTMQRALVSGMIHPEMEAREVALLRSPKDSGRGRSRVRSPRSDDQIEHEIAATLRGWWQRFPHKREFLVDEVAALSGRSLTRKAEEVEEEAADDSGDDRQAELDRLVATASELVSKGLAGRPSNPQPAPGARPRDRGRPSQGGTGR